MAAELRRLGANIEEAYRAIYDSILEFAKDINLSENDVYRLFEGRLLLSPSKIKEVSRVLNKPLGELLDVSGNYAFVECMGNFTNMSNEDKILDIIDNYIDLVETVS